MAVMELILKMSLSGSILFIIISNILEALQKTLNINKKIIIRECSYIKSPMITGILNPIIIIPQMKYNKEKLEIIFTHELLHYKRKDLVIKVMALIVNIINWFNPIVYILRNNINTACELSIDEVVVKNMDKDKRKYYVKIILELLENSMNKPLAIGTALYNNKKELENRLKRIVYFKKTKKTIMLISIFTAMIFVSTSVLASTTVFSDDTGVNIIPQPAEFAVFVSKDGLYMSDLKENNPVVLDSDSAQSFAQPLISRDGQNVAYIKNNNLYICNIKTKEIQKVADDIDSYDFNSKNDLVYSTKSAGISIYKTETKKSAKLISNEYNYYNIKCDSKNIVYANKRYENKDGDNVTSKPIGIISYDLNSKTEKTVLESKSADSEDMVTLDNPTNAQILEAIGSTPVISKISTDDRYLYIWNRPNSASTSSDINQFIVYDTINNKIVNFTEDTTSGNNEGIYGLHYEDNISQNPLDSSMVAVNEGVNRDMFNNKNLGIADIKENKFIKLLPENKVSMTPCYSKDGKNILYSASDKLDGEYSTDLKVWQNQPHNIYEINTETQKITQVTSGKYFDFMPKYLSNNEILFIRNDGDSFSLWKTKDGVLTKLGDSLDFNGDYIRSWYYGHYETARVIDVFVK